MSKRLIQPRSYDCVVDNWIDVAVRGGESRFNRFGHHGERMYHDGVRIFSYGNHFEMGRALYDRKGNAHTILINGERASVTTSKHQSYVRAAAMRSGVPSVIIPYGAMEAAGIILDSVRVLQAVPDRWLTINHQSKTPPRWAKRVSGETVMRGEWSDDAIRRWNDWHDAEQHEKNIDEKRQRVEWARKDLETRESSYWGDPDVLQAELEAMILAGSENYGKPSGYGAGHVWRSPPPDLLVPTGRSVDGYADSRNAYEIYGARADGIRGTAWRDDLTMAEPDADGVWRWQTRRHILGESLIVADVQAWRGGKRIKRRNVKFLSGFDHGEPHLAYFFCEMPKCDATTVDDAYEALKPDAVRLAEQMNRDVVRQGDIFAIATSYQRRDLLKQAKRHGYRNVPKRIKTWGDDNKLTPEYLRTERASMLLGTNHQGTEVIHANDGTIYARGCLWHVPDGRTNDHVRKKLGDGKTWYIILKNTVPVRKTR